MVNRRTYLGMLAGVSTGTLTGTGTAASRSRSGLRADGVRAVQSTAPIQQAKLFADDGEGQDKFGQSVAIDGSTALVGAHLSDPNGVASGAVYVFEQVDGTWTQRATLTPTDGDERDNFGQSVALDGATALIGAAGDEDPNGDEAGSAYVFTRTDGSWTQQAKLSAADGDPGDEFGRRVALDGSTALISGTMLYNTGAAYVFEQTNDGWTQQAKLTAADGESYDGFGESVALDGSTVLVGAQGDDPNGSASGSAYVFERTDGAWTQQAKLTAADGEETDYFGSSVAVDGSTVFVGAEGDEDSDGNEVGSVYVFERTDGTWAQQTTFAPDEGSRGAGFAEPLGLAVDGSTVLVGASNDQDSSGVITGAAYVFERTDGAWTQQAAIVPDDADQADAFGWSVALEGSTMLIGARADVNPEGAETGSTYVFEASTETSTQTPTGTPTQTPTGTPTQPATETTGEAGPGLGVVSALTALGGASYLLSSRSSETDDEKAR